MEGELEKFYKKLISYCIFVCNKTMFSTTSLQSFLYLIQVHAISSL